MSDATTTGAGMRSPKILYGTAWKKDDTARLVTTAIQLGFCGIDTACQPKHYNEAGVGAGIAACFGAAWLLLRNQRVCDNKLQTPSFHLRILGCEDIILSIVISLLA
jgi:diketogulonate reductase-like aldo/keto reductase